MAIAERSAVTSWDGDLAHGGGTVTGKVTADTECKVKPTTPTATASSEHSSDRRSAVRSCGSQPKL